MLGFDCKIVHCSSSHDKGSKHFTIFQPMNLKNRSRQNRREACMPITKYSKSTDTNN